MLYYFNVYSYQSEFQAVEPMHPPSIYTCINHYQKNLNGVTQPSCVEFFSSLTGAAIILIFFVLRVSLTGFLFRFGSSHMHCLQAVLHTAYVDIRIMDSKLQLSINQLQTSSLQAMKAPVPECLPLQEDLTTTQASHGLAAIEPECGISRVTMPSEGHHPRMLQVPESKPKLRSSMIQGKEILISGGNLTNVEGDYHEHIHIYDVEDSPSKRRRQNIEQRSVLSDKFHSIFVIVIVVEGLLNLKPYITKSKNLKPC